MLKATPNCLKAYIEAVRKIILDCCNKGDHYIDSSITKYYYYYQHSHKQLIKFHKEVGSFACNHCYLQQLQTLHIMLINKL